MIGHAVWIRFSDAAEAGERNAVLASFVALGDHLGHVSSIACGPDADGEAHAAGFGHAVVVTFETEAARDRYRALPEYAAAMERLTGAAQDGADGVRIVDPDPA